MAKIYLKFNTAVIKEIKLDKDQITFGRKSDNHVVIDHPTISGHHAKIVKDGDGFKVEDLNSTNGTFMNGHRVKSGRLKDRDQVGLAGHILDFYEDDSVTLALTPPPEVKPKLAPLIDAIEATPAPKPSPVPQTALPALPEAPAGPPAKVPQAAISVLSGSVNVHGRLPLKDLVTYIGTKENAAIKISGFFAPELAALITHRGQDFYLKALKPGYPKVNDVSVQDQILLENGARIEVGSAIMVFVKTD
jgi:pSer/pThr/pTyr-binding forkhead associated (FHA) protein